MLGFVAAAIWLIVGGLLIGIAAWNGVVPFVLVLLLLGVEGRQRGGLAALGLGLRKEPEVVVEDLVDGKRLVSETDVLRIDLGVTERVLQHARRHLPLQPSPRNPLPENNNNH